MFSVIQRNIRISLLLVGGHSSKHKKSKGTPDSQKKQDSAKAALIKMHGLGTVSVKLSSLFTGTRFVSSRLQSPVGTVEDLVITLSLDSPLLSRPQKKVLNPLVISVGSASNMPSKPLSYDELDLRYIKKMYMDDCCFNHLHHRYVSYLAGSSASSVHISPLSSG